MFVTFAVKNKRFSQFNMNSSFSNLLLVPGGGGIWSLFHAPYPRGLNTSLFGVFDKSPGGRTPGEAADTCIIVLFICKLYRKHIEVARNRFLCTCGLGR